MPKEIGIDLGSSTILVSTAEEEIIANEPAIVAYTRDNDRLYSIGHEALEDAADAVKALRVFRPLKKGIAVDADATRTMLSYALHLTCGNLIIKPRVLIAVPFDLNEEQESLLEWSAMHAGARETFLVYSPVAAMAGMGLLPDDAALIVDIGASQTSLLLMAGGKMHYKNTVHVGGDSFTQAIATYLYHKYGIRINSRSAEAIKLRIGTVWIEREDRRLDVRGKKEAGGEALTIRISSHEMFEALEEPTAALIAAICEAVEKIPPAYVGDVFRRGILLCGGGSNLDGLDKMISGVTGVNARVVDRAAEVIARGLGKILADLPTSMKNEKINVSARCMRMDM